MPTNHRHDDAPPNHNQRDVNASDLHVEIVTLGRNDNDEDDGVVISNDFSDDDDQEEFQGLLLGGANRNAIHFERPQNGRRKRAAGAIVVWTRPLGVWIVRIITILLSLGILLALMRGIMKQGTWT
jgi:hypothetical protein